MSDTGIAEAGSAECEGTVTGTESCARRHTADGTAPGRLSARDDPISRIYLTRPRADQLSVTGEWHQRCKREEQIV